MSSLNGRDGKGRFASGCKGGPGRPHRATEQAYLIAVTEAVSPERFRRIAERAAKDAERGNAAARRWLSDILVGRRANTAVALTVTEEARSIDFSSLTNDEFKSFDNIYNRMLLSSDSLSADDALAFVRLFAKSLRSDGRTDREWDD
jgi:hypothetical protein